MGYASIICPVLKFAAGLQKGEIKPPPFAVIVGEEPHLINEARTAIGKAAKASDNERTEFAELGDDPSAGGASLFGGIRLQNIVGHSSSFRQGKPPANAFDALVKIASRPPDNDIVVASFYGFDSQKMRGKLVWLGELQNKHKAKVIRAMQCDGAATAQWCKFWLPGIDNDAAAYIGEQSTGNFGAAKQAVMKMQLYGGATKSDAEDALKEGKRYGVFDLTDKLFSNDAGRGKDALKILAHLLAANEPLPLILWAIESAAWNLITIKRGGKVFNAWGDRLAAMRRIANYESEQNILEVIRRASNADRVIKGVAADKADDKGATTKIALTNLVVDLASLGRKARIPLPGRAVAGG